ncbi:DUF4097 family beta strand repeat-containing protein [Streptomyces apocyni]|uniref:DUF4097 family beta strand repeat-containing protein n=1 Tax=Streptomyces apocyni TaxID=2654677 RepID=UPI0012EABE87|nr:DUF4097 family beta strand repeat-containing protein [Streptomyces apocyni]
MRQLRVLAAVALAGAGVIGLGACGVVTGKTFEDERTVSKADTAKITSVRIDSGNGSVELRGRDDIDGATIRRDIDYRGDKPQGASHRIEDGVLVLGGCGRDCTVRYTVELPDGLPVRGETSNGKITLSRVGAVGVSTSNGAINLKSVSGAVDVKSGNGKVTGRGLAGEYIRVHTSNGKVDLTATKAQDIRARTSNGSVTLRVPNETYRVTTKTGNGSKEIGVDTAPDAAHSLNLSTGNGAISIQPTDS